MIKFFRKIRQRLLTENKFSRYLIYALGEIILVVLGILIALQINNWNEERKDQLRLNNHYEELISELKNDRNRLGQIIENVREINNQTLEISEFINSSQSKIDTTKIVADLLNIEGYGFFSVSTSAYTNLLSSGDIQLIKNTKLKNSLSIYQNVTSWDWTAHNGNLKDVIERYASYVHKFLPSLLFRDYYISIFSINLNNEVFNTYSTSKKSKIEWEKLKNDEEFRAIISQLLAYRVFQLKFYIEVIDNINNMIDLIETEIK